MHELQVQSQLQKLETDIIFVESSIRALVIAQDSVHMLGLTEEINNLQQELEGIKANIGDTASSELLLQLAFLIQKKIQHSNKVMGSFYKEGKAAAEAIINTNEGALIRDSITHIIHQINENRQAELSRISASVSTNGTKAKRWGIVLALVACIASIVAFWYLINQGQRQQRLIQTLDTSEKKLKEVSIIKEQFVANISHEIRTPMNAILGFASLLQKTTLNKDQHEYVKSIRSSAENLLTIINDILDLSRIESGMMHIEKLPFNLRELLHSLVTMLDEKAKNRSLYLHAEVDTGVPETLNGDAVRLTQVLLNLIGNGLKFTPEGGITIKVEEKERKNDTVCLRFIISDTGIGIDAEKQKTIFDRFQQAEAETTRRYGGTGLGLAIVKQLVDIQNGKISVTSELGKGSVFTVLLPYQIVAETETVFATSAASLPEPSLQKIKLLVAEDNAMNRKLIQHLLNQWQIDFDIVTNGVEVVKVLQQRAADYHLVLMDIQMPQMDGYTATDKIRFEMKLQIPIIAMTAHALAGEKEKCLGAGMDDYISKPLNEEQLYKLIVKYARNEKENIPDSVIDMEYLRSLSKGDDVFEKNMIRAFSEQMPREIQELKTAIDNKDYEKIKSLTHSMRSTVSYLGLQQLIPLLLQMEAEAENEKGFSQIYNNFALLEVTCQLAIKEAHEMIS